MFFEKVVPSEARDAFRRDWWGGILGGLYMGAIFPFVGYLARDRLGASVGLISLMMAAPFIGNLFALFYANAMEGKRKMPFVVWSLAAARGLVLFTVFATTPIAFALIFSAVQMIGTIATPAYSAILKEIYPDEHRGRIMAYIRVGMAFTIFVSTLLVGRLLNTVSFRYVFPIAGVLGVAGAFAFGSIKTAPVDPNTPRSNQVSTPQFVLKALAILKDNANYRWFALSVFTFGFGNLIAAPLYPVFQVDALHINATQVAVLSNISTIIWIFSYLYWGRYVDMRSPLRAVAVNVLLVSLIPLTYFLAKNVWMLIPAAVVNGITMGGIELSYFNSVLYFAEEGKESHYQALHSFMLGIRVTKGKLFFI